MPLQRVSLPVFKHKIKKTADEFPHCSVNPLIIWTDKQALFNDSTSPLLKYIELKSRG